MADDLRARSSLAAIAHDMTATNLMLVTPPQMAELVTAEVNRRAELFRNWYESSISLAGSQWDPKVAAMQSAYDDIVQGRWPT